MKKTEKPTLVSDAIVDEVRAVRAKLSARFGNDIDKLCDHLRSIEAQYRDRVVQPGKLIPKNRRRVTSGKRG
jgi:hypothetical protein